MTSDLSAVFADHGQTETAVPIDLVAGGAADSVPGLSPRDKAWIAANGFTGAAATHLRLPTADGGIARVLVGLGAPAGGEPCGPNVLNFGRAPGMLPGGTYRLASVTGDATLLAVAWGLGAYRDRRFSSSAGGEGPRLVMPEAGDADRAMAIVRAVHRGRDLINGPANVIGPAEIADAVVAVANAHGAKVTLHAGEDHGFAQAFPLVHAVGQASVRAPRVIDVTWGDSSHPKVTLIGKGICFDTGGLDIKPASAMLLMKKDMGGAASALAAAEIIMGLGLPVRLRLVIAAAENSIAGNAFRPGDVIRSRDGLTVEIGNTDAEGRLVLADAITLADAEAPDLIVTFATLTGAARVALGPDLPAFFSTDDGFADAVAAAGLDVGDPVWRMPLWPGYDRLLDSGIADLSNVSDGPFAGAITAALFLKRFVRKAAKYAHFDLYGWRPAARALGPKGGETHAARAVARAIEELRRNG